MKNLIISIIVAIIGFGLGYWGANSNIWAGFPAAIFAFSVCYFILARRSFKKFSGLSQTAMERMQGIQNAQDPSQQLGLIDQTITIFEEGFVIAKEQFMVSPMLHAQIGSMHYQCAGLLLQMRTVEDIKGNVGKASKLKSQASDRFAQAKKHLSVLLKHPWQLKVTKQWQPLTMLAIQENREGNKDKCLEILKSIESAGSDDPLFFGIYGWLLMNNKQNNDALLVVSDGSDKHKNHQPLKEMKLALQNKKTVDIFPFGQNWFAFFPEQLDRNMMMRMQQQMMANNPEQAKQFNRAQRRAFKKRGK